ncbi:hypothetical protein AB4Z52_30910 [Rhizobium sp. 2YAF20]|uniref:hypothetical protein n=1 Tax=Rhizobium sp. 2YAF20 TaxID=3233027 RepID=UPI003F9B53AD
MIPSPAQQLIDKIKKLCAEERQKIAELNRHLGPGLKTQLREASSKLDNVEQLFLDPKILAEDRNPGQWTRWLNAANKVFALAVSHRERVEKLQNTYGPDAKSF